MLGLLTFAFYISFTLLPNSSTIVVSWSWVFIWQVGLLCPVLWLLVLLWQRQGCKLGNGFDWLAGLLVLSLVVSTLFAPFPMQARWYGWAALCFLAALYALNAWLREPERRSTLLIAQGYLNLTFILVSLLLWSGQTLFPELERLRSFQSFGVDLPFDFGNILLRNWAPIGHQNYVAGYLALSLPLLVGLGIWQTGWRRGIWLAGVGLGVIDLYTTSSRAGWLAVFVSAIVGGAILFWQSRLPRRWLVLSAIAGLGGFTLLMLTNNRLQALLVGMLTGQGGGELGFRQITTTVGWQMGLSRVLTGIGPGGVPLLYQQFRPAWAGREAEWVYQLHSTPAQVWAEFGLGGTIVSLGTIILLARLALRSCRNLNLTQTPAILIGSLFVGLLAYSLVSLTDYQLDVVAIAGLLILYLAVLTAEFQTEPTQAKLLDIQNSTQTSTQTSLAKRHEVLLKTQNFLSLAGLAFLLVGLIGLIPIHRAWMLSSQSFAALQQKDTQAFVQQLTQAHELAPWEPYYAHQLGWNLGNLGLQTPQAQTDLVNAAIDWLQKSNQISPHQEFGHTNLAWLLLNRDPKASMQAFARSAQLVPAKRGVFYGLGTSLLAQGQVDRAVTALTLEALRDPVFLTSPVLNLIDPTQQLYATVVQRTDAQYSAMLARSNSASLTTQLHQARGAIRWWVGNLAGAQADLAQFGTPVSRLVLELAQGKSVQSQLAQLEPSAGTLAISAWLNPAQRQDLLRQAWIRSDRQLPPSELLQQLVDTMNRSATFDQWLKQNAPKREYRRERSGFGVLSRQIDGPNPTDFLTVIDNIPITLFFPELMPSWFYAPELDLALQGDRSALLQTILEPKKS